MIRFKKDDGLNYPDWEEKPINETHTIFKGAALSKADISENGTPFILYGELYTTYNEVTYEIARKTEKEVDKKYYSQIGDVVIPTSGETPEEISTATCVMKDGIILAGDLNIYRSKYVDGRFFSYLMNHNKKYEVAKIAQGASVIHIQASEVGKISIPIPCLEEQQKIAEFLSSVDNVIAASEQEIATLEEQKKGIMQKIFSQEVRFKADDGSDYPEWEENKLGNYISLQGGYAFKSDMFVDNGIPIIRISNINNGIIDIKNDIAYYEEIDIDDRFIVTNGDLLIAMSGATTGKTGIYKEEQKSYLNQRVGNFVLNCDSLVYSFLYHWVNTETFSKQLRTRLAAGAQPNISPSDIESMKILVPQSLEEQQKIADFLSNFDAAIDFTKQELEQWKELKKGLLQQLFE